MEQGSIYVRRCDGIICRWAGGSLVLDSASFTSKIVLNAVQSFYWIYADGTTFVSEIIQLAKEQISGYHKFGEQNPHEVFELFVELDIAEFVHQPAPARPILRLGLFPVWETRPSAVYLLISFLQASYTLLVVNPKHDVFDLLCLGYAESLEQAGGHDLLDKQSLSLHYPHHPDVAEPSFQIRLQYAEQEVIVEVPAHLPYLVQFLQQEKRQLLLADSAYISAQQSFHQALSQLMPPWDENPFQATKPEIAKAFMPRYPGKIRLNQKLKSGHLTIGMATYDDFDGVYFTIQAIRFFHREVLDKLSFVVVDNNPGGAVGKAIQEFGNQIERFKYIPFGFYSSTGIKDIYVREAETEYVLGVDSHIMIHPGALQKLIAYLDERPACMDLLQGPLVFDPLSYLASSYNIDWDNGMLGQWRIDTQALDKDGSPFEIAAQGSGLFACRRAAWPGFNPRFRGYAGEEVYINEKFRQLGRKTLCLPFLRWLHRAGRPHGSLYISPWEDRIRNYYLGFQEIGWDTAPVVQYFREHTDKNMFVEIMKSIRDEMKSPFHFFEAVYFIYHEDSAWEKAKAFWGTWISRMILQPIKIASNKPEDFAHARNEQLKKAIVHGLDYTLFMDERMPVEEYIRASIEDATAAIQNEVV